MVTKDECTFCGMPKPQWPDDYLMLRGKVYCCRGCANGIGCACAGAVIAHK